jgi:hypothetical protein
MSVNLLNHDLRGLAGFCAEIGEKPFRAGNSCAGFTSASRTSVV